MVQPQDDMRRPELAEADRLLDKAVPTPSGGPALT
jgi:hypothetical protein